jgi:predicted PurR-regulated permease PerM
MKQNRLRKRKIKRRKKVLFIYLFILIQSKIFLYFIATAVATNGTHTSTSRPQQTNPPSIPICELYPDGNYPEGQILEHPIPKNPPTDG